MTQPGRSGIRALFWLAPLVLVACADGAKTPEEAFLRLERAVAAGDAAEFYECLDATTRKSIKGAYQAVRLQRTIVQAKFPEAEQAAALQRLAAGAEPDERRYFVHMATDRRVVTSYRKRLGAVSGPILQKPDKDDVWVSRQDGMPFRFAKVSGGWGFAELRNEWALEHDRMSHAVDTIRENAALYQKAANP
jgi:hypothetical protein